MPTTLADRITLTGGRSSGFDYLRIGLALAVACSHIVSTTYGKAAMDAVYQTWWRVPLNAILPMFFALSGFLVAGSLERCRKLTAFLGLRVIRIVPALAVEVLISALILGPLLTVSPLADYLGGHEFRAYFLNILGEIHFLLPGVFGGVPYRHIVNQQLWTIPYELQCYAEISLLALIGMRRFPIIAIVTPIGTTLIYALGHILDHGLFAPTELTEAPGYFFVWAFLWGVALFIYRDRVRWSAGWCAGAAVIGFGSLAIGGLAIYVMPAALAYVTVMLGLANPHRLRFLEHADCSYGIYLYHWVVMQTVMSFAPRIWWVNLAISLPVTVALAMASWYLIERRALALRHPIMAADRGEPNWQSRGVTAFLAVAVVVAVAFRFLPV